LMLPSLYGRLPFSSISSRKIFVFMLFEPWWNSLYGAPS
jgi:hypothetical protein